MKKIVVTLLLFIGLIGYSQTNGITYQAVILNPSGEQLPGVNNTNAPLANKYICLKFSIIDNNSQSEYIETVQTTTDEFGMVNLVIGTGVQIGGYASSFSNILWNANPKSLKVDLSTTGICSYYTEISNQPFTSVPFALYAVNSESTAALAALQATVAANATATTNALALKEDAINKSTTTTLGTSNVLFPTQNAVKTYVDTNISTVNASNAALQATVTANATAASNAIAAVQSDVNQNELDSNAADVILQNNITTLQNTVTSNATATTTALGLKEDAANKSTTTTLGTSNVLFPTQNAVKTYVDTNISTVNASNAALQASVTANATAASNAIAAVQSDVNQNELDSNAADVILQNNITTLQNTVTSNATATITALGLKEDAANKSTDVTLADVSNTKFPTELAVKTYVTNQIATGTAANVSGIVAIVNGGTGSSLQNFVDLTTNQTVDGEKTFGSNTTVNANLYVNGEVSAPVVMVENGTFQTGTWGDNQWQSFTATSSGVLQLISIFGNGAIGARNGTLNIYSGTGTAGAQLFSGSVALPPFSGWFDLPIASSVSVVTGNIYTFQILDPNPVISPGGMVASENNLYPQGDYFSSVYGANSNYDLTFKAWISTVGGGNITASGTITAGSVTYPNTHGTANQVLTTNGSGTLAWSSPSSSVSSLTGTLAIANGGTGSSVQNFVDLTNNQNIAGGKYFTNNITANQVSIGSPITGSQNTMLGESSFGYGSPGSNNTGLGFFTLASLNGGNDNTAVGTNAIRQGGTANGSRNTAVGSVALSNGSEPNDNTALGYATLAVTSGSSNTAVGSSALQSNTTANHNVGVGFETLRNTTTGGSNTAVGRGAMYSNTSGDVNTAVGEYALVSNTNGRYNTSIGVQAQEHNTTGQSNTAIGVAAIDRNAAGNYNAVLGAFAGRYIADNTTFNTAIDNSVLIGALSRPLGNNANNEIVIGYDAIGNGSNTVQLGNTSVTNVKTSGTITAGAITIPNTDGTPNQVLTTNGSGALSWSTPSSGGATAVGAINSTSNANGASITAGELKLAPADATNGGVVTTGTQTFSGSKTVLGDLIVSTASSSPSIDQSHSVSYGIYGAGQTALGQSFTAGLSGMLNKVSMRFANSTCSGTLKIFSGSGVSGTLLTSQAFSLSSGNGYIEFTLNSPITVVNGTQYTMLFEKSTGNIDVYNSNDGSYTGGQAYAWGGLQSNLDNVFKTYVSTVSGGNITTSGSVISSVFKTPTGTSSQYLMADGSVSNSTLSNYLPLTGGNITGQLSIGTTTHESSAALDVTSTSQGLLPPRMTQNQRNAIVNKVAGLIIWCKDCGANGELQVYNGTAWTNFIGGAPSEPLVVGSAYRGGKIAYIFQSGDPGYVAGEFHGIIASNSDLSNGIRWGQGFNGLSTTYDCVNRHGSSGLALPCAIGAGSANTTLIITSCTESSPTDYAALICSNYSVVANGITYSDWFLPSKDEMAKLYQNKSLIGDLYYDSVNTANKSNWYWTSSGDVFQDRATDVNSDNGGNGRNFRGQLLSVRAVMYF
jgi:hypothetical protein